MKRIVIGVLAAWGGIVALAWWLADRRIIWCSGGAYPCEPAQVVTRDNVLIWGLAIPLGVFVLCAILGLVRLKRAGARPSTSRALHPRAE